MSIVALCGYARTGKDTAAFEMGFLNPTFKRYSFADELKNDIGILPAILGHDTPENKEAIRPLWVAYGHAARELDPGHWIARLDRVMRMDLEQPENRIITDCRYADEIDWVMSKGGLVICITRPGYGPANKEERDSFREIKRRFPSLPTVHNDGSPVLLGGKVYGLVATCFGLKQPVDPYTQTA